MDKQRVYKEYLWPKMPSDRQTKFEKPAKQQLITQGHQRSCRRLKQFQPKKKLEESGYLIRHKVLPRLIHNTIVVAIMVISFLLSSSATSASRDMAMVGVATNFLPTIQALKKDFEATTSHNLTIVSGASGQLFAQIIHGAPLDIFLSADQRLPEKLAQIGLSEKNSRFSYATGRLAVWFPNQTITLARSDLNEKDLIALLLDSPRIAQANETLAPYGLASVQVMQSLGVLEELKPRIVRGENIGQTFSMISSGNADAGFIALTQAVLKRPLQTNVASPQKDQYWLVDESLHEPIHQDAVLLKRAANNPAALAFIGYLRSPAARKIIREAGYAISDQRP